MSVYAFSAALILAAIVYALLPWALVIGACLLADAVARKR